MTAIQPDQNSYMGAMRNARPASGGGGATPAGPPASLPWQRYGSMGLTAAKRSPTIPATAARATPAAMGGGTGMWQQMLARMRARQQSQATAAQGRKTYADANGGGFTPQPTRNPTAGAENGTVVDAGGNVRYGPGAGPQPTAPAAMPATGTMATETPNFYQPSAEAGPAANPSYNYAAAMSQAQPPSGMPFAPGGDTAAPAPTGSTNFKAINGDANKGYAATEASKGPYAEASYGGAGGKGNKFASNAWEQGNFRSRTMGALDTTQGQANAANGAFLDKTLNYDPSKDFNTYMQGAWGQAYDGPHGLKQQLSDLAGSSVGRGRLDTGFYDTDNGTLIRDTMNDYANTGKTAALQTSALGLQNTGMLGNFGQNQQNNYLDLLSGAFDRQQGDEAASKKAKTGWIKPAAKIVGTVVGGVVGGPVGAAAGGALGGAVG